MKWLIPLLLLTGCQSEDCVDGYYVAHLSFEHIAFCQFAYASDDGIFGRDCMYFKNATSDRIGGNLSARDGVVLPTKCFNRKSVLERAKVDNK